MSKVCPQCGKESEFPFCPYCGRDLSDVSETVESSSEEALDTTTENSGELVPEAMKEVASTEEKIPSTEEEISSTEEIDLTEEAPSTEEVGLTEEDAPSTEGLSEEPSQEQLIDAEDKTPAEVVEEITEPKKKSKKTTLIIISIVAVLAVLGTIIGIAAHNKKVAEEKARAEAQAKKEKKEKEEAAAKKRHDEIEAQIGTDALSMMTQGADAEEVGNLVINVWHDSIWDSPSDETKKYIEGTSDFNDAIAKVYDDKDVNDKLTNAHVLDALLQSHMKELQPIPDDLQKEYDAYVETVLAYHSFVENVIHPKGNYDSYVKSFNEKDTALVDAYSKLNALLP